MDGNKKALSDGRLAYDVTKVTKRIDFNICKHMTIRMRRIGRNKRLVMIGDVNS